MDRSCDDEPAVSGDEISRGGLLMESVVFHSNMEDVAGIETDS